MKVLFHRHHYTATATATATATVDANKNGRLEPAELVSIIVDLLGVTGKGVEPVTPEQWCVCVPVHANASTKHTDTRSQIHTLSRLHAWTTYALALSQTTLPTRSIVSLSFVSRYFDQDGDGSLDRQEFFYLVEYVVAMNIIDASKESVTLDDDDSR